MAKQLKIYDTTLQNSDQWAGVPLKTSQREAVIRRLDNFGVDYLEIGIPEQADTDFAELLAGPWKYAKLAVGGWMFPQVEGVDQEAHLQAFLEAGTPVCTVVGRVWASRDRDESGTMPPGHLRAIEGGIAFLKADEREVMFNAEHFFDSYKVSPDLPMETLRAAASGGADTIILCDSQGGALPWEVAKIVHEVRVNLPGVSLGIHTHNDGESALANAVAAVGQGVSLIQGAINGYGQRSGNANLSNIIPDLELKMGIECLPGGHLPQLLDVAHRLAEVVHDSLDESMPYVGKSSLAPA
jgi:2-isopropylmalate synthase